MKKNKASPRGDELDKKLGKKEEKRMKKSIVIFNSKSIKAKGLVGALKTFRETEDCEMFLPENVSEAKQTTDMQEAFLLILAVSSKMELVDSINLLENLKKIVKKDLCKILCYNYMNNKKVDDVLRKYGVLEFMQDNLPERSLVYKFNLQFKALQINLDKYAKQKSADLDVKTFTKNVDPKSVIVFKSPINETFELWSINSKKEFTPRGNKWEIEVKGPSEVFGEWQETKDPEDAHAQKAWEWVYKKENLPEFVPPPGPRRWVFRGEKPTYIAAADLWIFSAVRPELGFISSGAQAPVYKIKWEKEEMVIAKDSRTLLDILLKLKKRAHVILNQGKEETDDSVTFDGEQTNISTMQKGDSEFNEELAGSLTGAVNGGADQIDTNMEGQLSSGLEDLGGTLSGKGGTDHIESNYTGNGSQADRLSDLQGEGSAADNLSDLTDPRNKSRMGYREGDLGGNMSGEGSVDELKDLTDPRSKSRMGYKEGDLGGQMSGEGSVDELKDLTDPRSKSRMGYKEGDLGGQMSGEGSVDELKDLTDPRSKSRMGYKEGDLGGMMNGEGGVDELKNLTDPRSKSRMGYKEGDLGGTMDGETSTDELKNLTDPKNKSRFGFKEKDHSSKMVGKGSKAQEYENLSTPEGFEGLGIKERTGEMSGEGEFSSDHFSDLKGEQKKSAKKKTETKKRSNSLKLVDSDGQEFEEDISDLSSESEEIEDQDQEVDLDIEGESLDSLKAKGVRADKLSNLKGKISGQTTQKKKSTKSSSLKLENDTSEDENTESFDDLDALAEDSLNDLYDREDLQDEVGEAIEDEEEKKAYYDKVKEDKLKNSKLDLDSKSSKTTFFEKEEFGKKEFGKKKSSEPVHKVGKIEKIDRKKERMVEKKGSDLKKLLNREDKGKFNVDLTESKQIQEDYDVLNIPMEEKIANLALKFFMAKVDVSTMKILDPKPFEAIFADFFDNLLILELPKQSTSKNSHYMINIDLEYLNKKERVQIIGKVDGIEESESGEFVNLIIDEIHLKKLGFIQSYIEKRQASVVSFIKEAKGF